MEDSVPEMDYRKLPLSCGCGAVADHISAVGISATRKFVFHWRCPQCRRNVYVAKSLLDCWKDCFTEAPVNLSNSKLPVDTADDRRFLHSVGITYSDE